MNTTDKLDEIPLIKQNSLGSTANTLHDDEMAISLQDETFYSEQDADTSELEVDSASDMIDYELYTIGGLCLFIFLAIVVQIILEIVVYPKVEKGYVRFLPRCITFIIVFSCYLAYWFLVFSSETLKCLSGQESYDSMLGRLNGMKKRRLEVSMKVECYHYETRKVVGRYDADSKTEKVTTFTENRKFKYANFKVVSKPFVLQKTSKKFLKISVIRITHLCDETTQQAFEQEKTSIQNDHRSKDILMNYSDDLKDFGRQEFYVRLDYSRFAGLFFNTATYYLFSFFLLNILYRKMFDHHCGEVFYKFSKELSKEPFE